MSSPQNPNPRSPPSSSPPLPQPSPPPLALLLSLRRRSPNPPPPPPPPPPFSSPPQPPPPPFSAPPSSPPQTSLLRLSLRRRTQQALTTDSSSPALFSPAPLHCSLLTATSSPLAIGRRPLPLSPPRPPSWRLLRPLVLRYRRPHSRHQGPAHQGNLQMGKTYVVFVGREPGIYDTWIEASNQVTGFKGAIHQSFKNREETEKAYYKHLNKASTPVL
ncbi:uncharacterized protein LOC141835075 [Curcuma longa]|uniref:uncharacterized protein LOC141835075 n=1 Tax=Curcuma longa TaxID=136217 RepID=UPI003D9EAA8F